MNISRKIEQLKVTYRGLAGIGLPVQLKTVLSNSRSSYFEVIQCICQFGHMINKSLYPSLYDFFNSEDEHEDAILLKPFENLYRLNLLNKGNVNKLISRCAYIRMNYYVINEFLVFMQDTPFFNRHIQVKFDLVFDHVDWHLVVCILPIIGAVLPLDQYVFGLIVEHMHLNLLLDIFRWMHDYQLHLLSPAIAQIIIEHANPDSIFKALLLLKERQYASSVRNFTGDFLLNDRSGHRLIGSCSYDQLPWVKDNMLTILTYPDVLELVSDIIEGAKHKYGPLSPYEFMDSYCLK